MKLILLLCLMGTLSWTNGFVSNLNQILQMTVNVSKYVSECMDLFEGDDVTKKADVRTLDSQEDSISVENITQCFFMKTGILSPEGKINSDSVYGILSLLGIDDYVSKELLNKCTSIVGFDAQDTTFAIFKCFEDGFKDLKVF